MVFGKVHTGVRDHRIISSFADVINSNAIMIGKNKS